MARSVDEITGLTHEIKLDISKIKREYDDISKNIFHDRDILDEIKDIEEEISETTKSIRKAKSELSTLTKGSASYAEKELKIAQLQKRVEGEKLSLLKKQNEVARSGYNQIDRFGKDWENRTALLKKSFKEIGDGVKQIGSGAVKVMGPWGKMSQAAANYAKQVGLSGKAMDTLRKHSISLVDKGGFGIKYNTSVEQLLKLQEGFIKNTGRQVTATDKGLENMAATSKILGDNTGQFMGRLENFGLSMEESGKRAGKMFASASKKGIAWENYSKNFLDNITLAQKYTFKNGLNGLASMAEKATQINLNMSQAAAFADKVSTVEGAITTGAQLQVLGGPFAQMADPLGMLYEGLNDMEGLQDRMIQMFGNLGQFNRKTGEVEISSFNRQRIKAAAQASGLDPGNVFEMINSNARRNEIARQLEGNPNIDKETAELLKNVGIIQNGRAGVSINGKFRDVKNITNADIKYLSEISRSESEDVKDIAQRLRGWDDSVQGFNAQKDATHANLVESMTIGKGIQNLVNTVGDMRKILMVMAGGAVLGGVAMAFGGGFKAIQGLSHLGPGVANIFGLGAKGAEMATKVPKKTIYGKKLISKAGQIPVAGEKFTIDGTKYVAEATKKGSKYSTKLVPRGGKALAKVGKFGGGLGLGLAGAGLSLGGDYLVGKGRMKAGGFGDFLMQGLGGAASGAGTGLAFGGGWGALIGGILGATNGILQAEKRRKIRKIGEESGLQLNGDYGYFEIKKIRAALKGERDLSDELKEKMIRNGDIEAVDKINNFLKNEVIKVQVVKAQRKAGGGIVEGDTKTGDKIPVFTNAGELILNEAQQNVIANKLSSPVVPRPDVSLNITPSVPAPQKPMRIEFGDMNINFNGDDVNIKGDGMNMSAGITKQIQQQIANSIKQDLILQIKEGLFRDEHAGRMYYQRGYEYNNA